MNGVISGILCLENIHGIVKAIASLQLYHIDELLVYYYICIIH